MVLWFLDADDHTEATLTRLFSCFQDYLKLQKDLDEERKARKRLENMLRKSLRSIVDSNYEDNKIVVHS